MPFWPSVGPDFGLRPISRDGGSFTAGNTPKRRRPFTTPMWQGIAWFRAADFKQAAAAFSRRETPEAFFNQGNALVMAVLSSRPSSFSPAKKRPNWKDAEENRELAKARAKLTEGRGGDLGDQREGADKVVFDQNKKDPQGQETEVAGDKAMSTESPGAIGRGNLRRRRSGLELCWVTRLW